MFGRTFLKCRPKTFDTTFLKCHPKTFGTTFLKGCKKNKMFSEIDMRKKKIEKVFKKNIK